MTNMKPLGTAAMILCAAAAAFLLQGRATAQ